MNFDEEKEEGGVHCEWLNLDDAVVCKSFVDEHTNNNCIIKQKVRDAIQKHRRKDGLVKANNVYIELGL
jgi:hypothetical protein